MAAPEKETGSRVFENNYQIFSIQSKVLRAIWLLIVVAATVGFGIHLYSLIRNYFAYRYYDVVRDTLDRPLVFPHVTICDTKFASEYVVGSDLLKTTFFSMLGKWHLMSLHVKTQMMRGGDRDRLGTYWSLINTSQALTSNVLSDKRTEMGISSSDLVVSCHYGLHSCSAAHFSTYLTPAYYACHTYKGVPEANATTPNIGPENGLSLILVAQGDVINPLYEPRFKSGNVESLRVSVHEPGTDPSTVNTGIDILPGTSTSLALTQKEFRRLRSPYAHCQDRKTYIADDKQFLENPDMCMRKCLQEWILERCGCVGSFVDVMVSDSLLGERGYCAYINMSDPELSINRTLCELHVFTEMSKNALDCECRWVCEETNYDVSISQAIWPQRPTIPHFAHLYLTQTENAYARAMLRALAAHFDPSASRPTGPTLLQMIRDLLGGALNLSDPRVQPALLATNFTSTLGKDHIHDKDTLDEAIEHWVQNSFYRLNIYFNKGTVQQHQQVVATSLVDFWSGAGGVAGLWIGASLLSVFEAISFAVSVCYKFSKEKKGGKVNRIHVGGDSSAQAQDSGYHH